MTRASRSAAVVILLATAELQAQSSAPAIDLSLAWQRAEPAEVGLDAARLQAAVVRAQAIPRFRSLLVARRGRLVLERYFADGAAETLFDVRSVTKSVVSTLAGIALREGALGLDDSIAGYLDGYELDAADAAVTPRHLLTMTSGYRWEELGVLEYNLWVTSSNRVQYLLDRPQVAAPGAQFNYNSAAVHVLGVVLQRATRTPLNDYARPRLFAALGAEASWEILDPGTVNGGAGIRLRARDLLTFGQLFLQRGFSGERSVVPAGWVDEATRPHFSWRNNVGPQRLVSYGELWWTGDAAPAAFFAWGYGGQFVYVVPSLELVVVTTTEWRQLLETTPALLAEQVLGVIVEEVVAAAVR